MSLKERIFGDSRTGPVAHVQYHGFQDRESSRSGISQTSSQQQKQVVAPSGHMYTFRQNGESSNRLPVRSEEDAEFFEQGGDEWEVIRE